MTQGTSAAQDARDEQHEQTQGSFWRRSLWVLLTAVLLAALATTAVIRWSGNAAALEDQRSQISGLEGDLAQAEWVNAERIDTDLLKAMGASRTRLDDDTRVITRLADTAFTWDSGQGYEQARTDLKEGFALSDEDLFLAEFMPPSRYNEDDTGTRYYYIDSVGMNSSLSGDPDVGIVRVNADEYNYAVQVDVAVTSNDISQNSASPGRVTAERRMLLFVTVDAQGGISDLSGAPASGSTRQSG